jgi:hypothetical protein
MKRWIVVLVVMLVVAPCGARADEASKQAKVRDLFATMHMEHMLDQMMHSIQGEVEAVAQSTPAAEQTTPQQKKVTQDFMDKSMKVVTDSVGWTALEPEYVKLYASTYSEVEIDGILAFYKSPVGQAMLAKTPQLSAGGMQIVRSRMGSFQPKIQALQQEYLKQLAATMPAAKEPAKP